MVSISIIREIGPIIIALICAGKIGSGIGAEIGSMRVTEQIDAMEVSGTNPFKYLVVTRILATTFMLPILVIFGDVIALFGGHPGSREDLSWIMFAITLFAGLTMVTNIPYYSFKDAGAAKSVPFITLVVIALLFALVSIEPATMLFLIFVLYSISGYVIYAWRRSKGQHASIVATSTDEPDERGLHHD